MSALVDLYAGRQSVLENRRTLLPRLKVAAQELPELRTRVTELRAGVGTLKVTLDGQTREVPTLALSVNLGRREGNFPVTPDALLADGDAVAGRQLADIAQDGAGRDHVAVA